MPLCVRWSVVAVALLLFLPSPAYSQRPFPVENPVVPGLNQLVRSSGYIFAGTVIGVQRVPPQVRGEVATVRVTFRVEQAVRGVRTGQTLEIHEWAGLWESGERYHAGERVLLFLYRPSRLGLTSPVGGPMGRFHVDRNGQVILQSAANPRWPSPTATGLRPGKTGISLRNVTRAIRSVGRQ
jgi:hypothetical protein